MHRASPTRHWSALAIAGALALAAAGCGDEDDYENRPRPPAPIAIAASINEEKVSVSPRRFGAGPIELVITNQSRAAQQVTLESDGRPGSGPGTRPVETGPINPSETASVKADVEQGTYVLRVAGEGVVPARLRVGPARESAQNELLQP